MRRFLLLLTLTLGTALSLAAQSGYFWDEPEYLVRQGGRFPTAVDNGKMAAAFWQERRSATGWPQVMVSLAVRHLEDSQWTVHKAVLGPFTVVGSEAQIYSAYLTPSGTFWVAILADGGQVVLYKSDDGGKSFQEDGRLAGNGNLLVPRLFAGLDGEPLLMVNQADANSFRLFSSRKLPGGDWAALSPVTPEADQRQSFQPTVVRTGNTLVLVYQSQFTSAATDTAGARITYQIYRKDSSDGGLTWGSPLRLSSFADDLAEDPNTADNQRPSAAWFQDRLFVAWERRTSASQTVVELASYDAAGRRIDNQALTGTNYIARNPLFYTFRGRLNLAWFDNRNAAYDVFLSQWDPDPATGWSTADQLTTASGNKSPGNSVFGQPARLGNDLYFFWQDNFGDNPGIVMLQPDRRVDAPVLRPVNFKVGVKTRNPAFTVQVVYPDDVSGIKAFNTVLSTDPAAEPDHEHRQISKDGLWTQVVPQEGTWYLAVEVEDKAGNWSTPVRIVLDLKTSPPGPVLFDRPGTDAYGYLPSNTFRLSWKATSADAVSYSWRLSRVGDTLTPGLLASLKVPDPAASPTSAEAVAGATNLEDGLWALAVAAFDEAGNRGPVSTQFFRLNKFVPSTQIWTLETVQDAFGRIQLTLRGRGFAQGGNVDRVYLDRDGKAPYDTVLTPGAFKVEGDRLIDGIRLEDLTEGTYLVGVRHPTRGEVFYRGKALTVEPTGTVKIGDFRHLDSTVWEFFSGVTVFFSVHALEFWAVLLFLVLVFFASSRLLASAWVDRRRLEARAHRLFSEDPDKWGPAARRKIMKTKGLSLRVKFAASILGLTGSVILILSVTLGFFITENSQRTLGTALQQRTQVLLDSLATGARTYLPTANYNELSNLPQQIAAMEGEALYATITGPGTGGKAGLSYVYASNDPKLKSKIDTPALIPGVSVLKDPVEPLWTPLQKDLNAQAEEAVGSLVRQIEDLTKQARPLAEKTDTASRAQLTQFEDQNSALKREVIAKLAEVGGKARTFPAFDTRNLVGSAGKTYLFYQPFLYFTLGDAQYVRGLIRIEVSSESILKQINASRDQLILLTVLLALVALALGLVGSLLLSAITINPINKLVRGVARIRDTQDKTELEGHVIDVKTRDELEDLASTVNQMIRGLVDGASRTQDLTKGKVEQKTLFIPLDKDSENLKLSTFHRDFDDIEVFAYYEGAKLVSGDLYEFRQLDTRFGQNKHSPWYGIMKGDVSGKGVEAGMIMAIAAMFVTTFFRRWTEAKDSKDTKVDALLYQINDTIEPILAEAGRGLFVALNIGILNTKTGALRFSQAGDNVLHVWRGRSGTFESVDLKKTVSVGAMPSSEHRIRYENRDLVLEGGDTLLYFTDGVEESQSAYRNEAWEPVAYFDPSDPTTIARPNEGKLVPLFEGGPMEDVKAQNTEAFSPERIEAVVRAYYNREVYHLIKENWMHPDHTFHFDFRSVDGSAAGLVTALISIDRIFRLVPDPKATLDDFIDLDLVQDQFLREHFVEYGRYFKDGYQTYEQGDPSKNDVVDAQGYKLKGAQRVPLWQKGDPSRGEEVDQEGYLLDDGERVPVWEKADPRKKEPADSRGHRLVGGRKVPSFLKGDPARGDVVDAQGYKLAGGYRVLQNPGYIRYNYLKEDHQFDDLTLLAIRRK